MKLGQIVTERARIRVVPVDVEFEYEFEDKDGDYDSDIVVIEVEVTMESDPYGTGDSPEDYTPTIVGAYYQKTEQSFNWRKLLEPKDIKWILSTAVSRADDSLD
jgi:hypothetical protein